MKNIFCIIPAVLLFACGDNEERQNKKDSAPDRAVMQVSDVQVYRPDIGYTPWEGNLRDAVYWRDSLGENVFIVASAPQYFWQPVKPSMQQYLRPDQDPETFEEATELFAYHYVLAKGEARWKLHSHMNDYLMGCCDVYMDYQAATLEVVNADSNGTGEVVFMYHATEADGILTHDYTGTMVLHHDTTYYRCTGSTGLGNAEEKADAGEEKCHLAGPESYRDYLLAKWDTFCDAQLNIDRASSEPEAAEDSHEGHNH